MDPYVSPKDEIRFLRVCHHISNAVYMLYVYGHTADAGDVVDIRAVSTRAVFVRTVGKPSAGTHAVGVRILGLRTLSGYAVVESAIV
jgi:hypothetical protein